MAPKVQLDTRVDPAAKKQQLWQDGPQYDFLTTEADIAIMGGAAGGGKTYSLLLDPLRWLAAIKPGLSATFFRRTIKEITRPGGLWEESTELYARFGGIPTRSPNHMWTWRNQAKNAPMLRIQMTGLEHDKDVHRWQGSQLPIIYFDELTTFLETQFWYMLSRNRTKRPGVRPYVRATTNPDADSWVARLVDWWINPDTGYAIPQRSGVLRWFVRINETLIWGDDPSDLVQYTDSDGRPITPKSLTFIPATLDDNPALTSNDPGYEANLMALGTVERERLRYGNWKIRVTSGDYFNRNWCEVVDPASVPVDMAVVRGWDLAATKARPGKDPDWTCGTKMGRTADGTYYVLDHVFDRESPGGVERMIRDTAEVDGFAVGIAVPQDPGQAGKSQVRTLARLLDGFNVRFRSISGDKITRFKPFSAQAEAGNVKIVRGAWNKRWWSELENFPPVFGHDDDADATAEAFNALLRQPIRPVTGSYEIR